MSQERYEGDAEEQPLRSRAAIQVPLPIVLVMVLGALTAGYLIASPKYPLDNSADAGFLRDMSVHHDQAVDMSMEILDKVEDPTLRTVVYDMARTQQAQIGRMRGWLVQWDLDVRGSQPPMTWMAGHDHGYGGEGTVPEEMPGYASPEDLEALHEADGEEAEIIFLELMIPHHQGGVEMAEAAVDLASVDYVVTFAENMAEAQDSEIELLESLLEERRD
jgi:uncharacterized protein (DUF305 family)